MNKHQQQLWNKTLNNQLAQINRGRVLSIMANLDKPAPCHATWRQYLLATASEPLGHLVKDLYRQQLNKLREYRVAYTLASKGRFPALYSWLREAEAKGLV